MALRPEDDAVEHAGKKIGREGRGGGAEIAGGDEALGQKAGSQPHQREDQGIKAGEGRGQQQIADHAPDEGVHRAGGGTLQRGGNGGQKGIEKGEDAEHRKAPEHGALHCGPDQTGQRVKRPFKNRGAAGQHGNHSFSGNRGKRSVDHLKGFDDADLC